VAAEAASSPAEAARVSAASALARYFRDNLVMVLSRGFKPASASMPTDTHEGDWRMKARARNVTDSAFL